MIDPRLKNGIIIVVTSVWAVNFLAGLLIKSYEPDQAINAIFMAIVGGLFALGARGETKSPEKDSTPRGGEHKGTGTNPPRTSDNEGGV